MPNSIITLTTAPAGTGKTYRRCAHFLLTELLPLTEQRHISNFPIKFDPWGDNNERLGLLAIASKRGLDSEAVRGRVEVIPQDVLDRWRDAESGPWEYFGDKDIAGCHIAIDEIHNYCGATSNVKIRREWQKWLGEIRHRGAVIEFISQHPQKIAKEIINEAEVRLSLVSGATRRDPFFGILINDWYQWRAKLTGRFRPAVWELEKRMVDGRWVNQRQVVFWFEPELFDCYDSFSAPVAGGVAGQLEKEPWETKSLAGLFKWFTLRNLWPLTSRMVGVTVFAWVTIGQGSQVLLRHFLAFMREPVHVVGDDSTLHVNNNALNMNDSTQDHLNDSSLSKLPPGVAVVQGKNAVSLMEPSRPPPQWDFSKNAEAEQAAVKEWAVSLLSETGIMFANGHEFSLGEQIDFGPYKGVRLDEIDMQRRACRLGGVRIWLGGVDRARVLKWSRDAYQADHPDGDGSVSGSVQSGRGERGQ